MSSGFRIAATAFGARKIAELLNLTYRYRWEEGGGHIRALRERREPAIISIWHNRILCSTLYMRRELQAKGHEVMALISRSDDGELISRVIAGWGATSARGSSSRGGGRALREMKRWLDQSRGVVVTTPDGPRGPVYRVQQGTVVLAQLTGVPVYPMSFWADRSWRLRSWDRFMVPWPFARVAIAVGEPIRVPRDLNEGEREDMRLEIESAMVNTDREASAAVRWSGRLDR